MGTAISRTWLNRLFLAVFITVTCFVLSVLLKLGPEPMPFVVAMAVVLSLIWLVFDIFDEDPTEWTPSLPTVTDRVDEPTADLRVLTSHQRASVPSEALRDRLLALARSRDPVLADHLHDELAVVRRLSPTEIDRILTRIEAARDPH